MRRHGAAVVNYLLDRYRGHRLGDSSLALTEMSFNHGRDIVSISSVLNREFIEHTLTNAVPDFMPLDS